MKKRADIDAAIKQRYSDYFTLPAPYKPNPHNTDNTYDLPIDEVAPTVPEANIVNKQGAPLHPTSMEDYPMNAEVLLPKGEDMQLSRVIRQNFDSNGKVIGKYNNIPILNTILDDVKLPDGAVKAYAANIMAYDILNKVDEYGYNNQIINTTLDHLKVS